MNETPFVLFSALAAAATGYLLIALALGELRARRRRSRDADLRTKYLHVLMLTLMNGDDQTPQFPQVQQAGGRMLLSETLASVMSATYGLDPEPLQRIVARHGLDGWLLSRMRYTWGYDRARSMALLAQLPADNTMAARADRYLGSRNRYVRFYALMTRLAADPSTALRLMAEYEYPFSATEVAEIMTLLRRGMLPIAYEPLVASPNRNLRLVGLGIVRQFGIEEAETLLLRMVASDDSPELAREALYTLCSMHRPLSGRAVAARIASMNPAQRRALLRFMALEGYSPRALRQLIDERERPYYESLVQSYKRCLA